MATNKRINELPIYSGDPSNSFIIMNNSGETTTYKIQRELFLGTSQQIGRAHV